MNFKPCIDLHQGKVKQIVGATLRDSDNYAKTNFESPHSPEYYARLYQRDNLRGGHVIMLGPGNEEAARDALQTWPGGLQIGGGIRHDNAQTYLDWGASHVIMTSFIFHDGHLNTANLKKTVQAIGKERLVLDLSCMKIDATYYIVTNRWQNVTTLAITQETLEYLSQYCDEFLIHAAHVEGKMAGPDYELISLLGNNSPITTTYAGGVHTLEDLTHIRKKGKNRIDITIGSALDIFGGPLPYTDIVAATKE
ncbi:phosphoribosylformimino-5-aminoimidazole carboxamide ribotide isomerase [Chitinivibrio alkaliphilus]|uniref:Phosphoribosylformimino-5-aminoimidazole carboxamide ribotide isomerase n=1 Tax=Chitinivibrio alkaliphilus ACht1 TaxID=1313304 RepID=U7D826_9BACT|nr:phosphoribosylformimino-5-aminoimidazole carboxamide ribotide isomerase [Chitinivibrio alkaliphilus]ERP32093.1 phosphoribosylformimino-5-aminoimidazole carboxamide ribotide isomerase [Chitinivibrio alkaliphilus ACht1]